MTVCTGIVARLVRDKSFGFLRDTTTQKEYFFHKSDLAPGMSFDEMSEGDGVQFEEVDTPKGPRAKRVDLR